MKKRWYDYLWIASAIYLALGFFNILFAWLGLICFITPLLISIIAGNKGYCNKFCGRGQLFELLGGKFGLSRKKAPPKFLRSKWFRYGFLTFFMAMFCLMLYNTYLVFAGATLREAVTLLWMFKLPWQWTNTSFVAPGIAQFAFGFYGVAAKFHLQKIEGKGKRGGKFIPIQLHICISIRFFLVWCAVILFQYMNDFLHPVVRDGIGDVLAGFAGIQNRMRLEQRKMLGDRLFGGGKQ